MTLFHTAYNFALKAHEGQTRRDKKTPYIKHINEVLKRISSNLSDVDMAIAALHDVIEDTPYTFSDIRAVLLADHPDKKEEIEEIINGVATLTKWPTESYSAFINRIYNHCHGRWVHIKIADILANLSENPTPKQIRKYAAALMILTEEWGVE